MSSLITKIFLVSAALLAIAGVVLFFPISFSDQHTCLLDHLLHAATMPHAHPGQLLRHYLIPYGILWWSSILAVIAVVLAWWRARATSKSPSSGQQKRRGEL